MPKDERPHCGLCMVFVDNWKTHLKSKQHRDNLKDPGKLREAGHQHILQNYQKALGTDREKGGCDG